MELPKEHITISDVTDIPPAPYRLYFWSGSDDETRREFGIRFPYEDYATLEEARSDAANDPEACAIVNRNSGETVGNFCLVRGEDGPVDLRIGV